MTVVRWSFLFIILIYSIGSRLISSQQSCIEYHLSMTDAIMYCYLFLSCWKLILGMGVWKHALCLNTPSVGGGGGGGTLSADAVSNQESLTPPPPNRFETGPS